MSWKHIVTKIFLIALMSIGLSQYATAENTHYRWVDERGNPVHSDRPPEDGRDYEVITTGSSLVREVQGTQGAVPPETEPRVGNEFEQTDKEMSVVKKNPEYCERARKNLEVLTSTARIRVRDANGEFRFLDEEEMTTQREKAEDSIAVHCD